MKKFSVITLIIIFTSCSGKIVNETSQNPVIEYEIDITNHLDDIFHVSVTVDNLSSENNIYNFVATAPGTYQVLDFGRFVNSLKAFDKNGSEINIEKISDNKWKIEDPQNLALLDYDIEDSFDAIVKEYPVSPMCGSGIENDFTAINTFAVLGYFSGLQSIPIRLNVKYPDDWDVGTALPKEDNNLFSAENFDHLADSPLLLGDLSYAETYVNDISVQIYLFSEDTSITAMNIMELAEDIFQSASNL